METRTRVREKGTCSVTRSVQGMCERSQLVGAELILKHALLAQSLVVPLTKRRKMRPNRAKLELFFPSYHRLIKVSTSVAGLFVETLPVVIKCDIKKL